ncbi:tripartite tricarboxylate transporter permease [Bosea sp. (in: a-proteobacteria)]|uniref:tripartite tricarboxylate transporter permease n=1 Tax=Bosea sp. (in: a-proteobacteria) TaxID=1871050 RepID=UPI002626060C|nr:tripartite tricarboxylate transporter permease [Bosea sp. (in: a-proteobacteria)]MCO5089479.1 tripartite tricarboxylate transporter permease [Bosea sp. (in: a-proteobacteria)]
MDILSNIALGLSTAITPDNLLYCLVGCLLGTLVGVLPGLGPAATIAMLLPLTFGHDATGSLIMLAGIYYGAQYGGSTTAMLINLPGEPSSVVTALDGYKMARAGRAGPALAIAALASFFAGTIATVIIAFFAPVLGAMALTFGAAEYFSLMVLGLVVAVALARGSFVKALGMVVLGVTLGLIGSDRGSSDLRFTFGILELSDGLNIVAVAMGMFGITEVIHNLPGGTQRRSSLQPSLRDLWPQKDDIKASTGPAIRGTAMGVLLGMLPGGGAMLSSFAAYLLEKKLSREPQRFGNGAIEGVAAPEAANNAGAQMSFIPLLTLGIPSNVNVALIAGALIIQGIQPGPGIIHQQPTLFWGLIASMWVGNLMLVILNLPLVGLWTRLLTVPYSLLYPSIIIFCCIGVYSLNNSPFDVYIMIALAFFGYVLRLLDCEPAPLILGMVLGPLMEEYLRRAMQLSRGNPMIFIERPLSAALVAATVAIALLIAVPMVRRSREIALQDE